MRCKLRSKNEAVKRNWSKYRLEGALANLRNIRRESLLTNKERQLINKADHYLSELMKQWPDSTKKLGFNE